ncbi:MAG: DUF2085 domain-containing protein [Ignavibacteriales bacterium]|nr:DUF2085 domain-containing protein [Ignavibacteriales bacterium]
MISRQSLIRYLPAILLFLLLVVSFLPFYTDGSSIVYPFTKSLFTRICHGMADRCFEIDGIPLHLCSRCLGIYSGLFAGSITILFLKNQIVSLTKRRYLLIAFSPILINKLLELFTIIDYSKVWALISGILSGYLIFLYIGNRFLINFSKKK